MSEDNTLLPNLLKSFDAQCMGQGDLNTGANLLVAQAILLGNLSAPGSGIRPPSFRQLPAGCSLLASGISISGLLADELVEVGRLQNNLLSNAKKWLEEKVARQDKENREHGKSAKILPDPLHKPVPLEPWEMPGSPGRVSISWPDALRNPPRFHTEDLAASPKFFVSARNPEDLRNQLSHLYGNRPLIALGLNEAREVGSYAGICQPLLNGPYPIDSLGRTITGHLVVTDPGPTLPRVAREADPDSSWLGRMIWLTDSPVGPEAPRTPSPNGSFPLTDTGARFQRALESLLARRLEAHDQDPVLHDLPLHEAQVRWVAYLKKRESRLPGISGTARHFLATLAFGLIELAKASSDETVSPSPKEIEALARWVIERMANARAAMLQTQEREARQQVANRILHKLGDGRFTKRELYRALGIPADPCETALLEMKTAGLVRQVDDYWERVDPDRRPGEVTQHLFLDVA